MSYDGEGIHKNEKTACQKKNNNNKPTTTKQVRLFMNSHSKYLISVYFIKYTCIPYENFLEQTNI